MGRVAAHAAPGGAPRLCAIKDLWSNRIAGYSMDSRMTAALHGSADIPWESLANLPGRIGVAWW